MCCKTLIHLLASFRFNIVSSTFFILKIEALYSISRVELRRVAMSCFAPGTVEFLRRSFGPSKCALFVYFTKKGRLHARATIRAKDWITVSFNNLDTALKFGKDQ